MTYTYNAFMNAVCFNSGLFVLRLFVILIMVLILMKFSENFNESSKR